MSRHALREADVPNAISGAPKPEVLAGATTTKEVMAKLHAGITLAKAQGGPQGFTKASTQVLDILVTTSADDTKRIGKAGQDDYFRRALEFIGQQFGGIGNILTAAIHRDETTPHMQVLVMPLDRTTSRFSAAKMIGGPMGLSKLQDAFHEACGARHELLRGEKGSRAKHVPVKVLYTAMENGDDVPAFVSVPPAPSVTDRLRPDYAAKKQAHTDALAKNEASRKKLTALAKTGRMMHPKMIARQAGRYREAVRLEAVVKEAQAAAAADLVKVQSLTMATRADLREVQTQAQAADSFWTKSGAQAIDKLSAQMAPEMIQRVARSLNIELVAGKPLLDQMRRQGRGRTLLECAQLLDKTVDGVLQQHVITQREGEAPRPRER